MDDKGVDWAEGQSFLVHKGGWVHGRQGRLGKFNGKQVQSTGAAGDDDKGVGWWAEGIAATPNIRG